MKTKQPNSYRTLRTRKSELDRLIFEAEAMEQDPSAYKSELAGVMAKITHKESQRNAKPEMRAPIETENMGKPQEQIPPADVAETQPPETPGNDSFDMQKWLQETAAKSASSVQPDVIVQPVEVKKEEIPAAGNDLFEAENPESEIVPGGSAPDDTADNLVELFLDNELVSDIILEGLDAMFVDWFPSLYLNSKFTPDEQRVLMRLQFRQEKGRGRVSIDDIEEHEYPVLQKYLLMQEYRAKLPLKTSERNNIEKCLNKLLKNKAIKMRPEMGLIITILLATGRRAFPIFDDKLADAATNAFDRMWGWLDRITAKAEQKRYGAEEQ